MDPQNNISTGKKSVGPIIGTVVIIVLLIIAGFYFWGSRIASQQDQDVLTTTSVEPVSKSDEVESIENDLNATGSLDIDLSGLDNI